MSQRPLIASVAKTIDKKGCMQHCLDIEARILATGVDIEHLYIEPLSSDWHSPSKSGHFKSGCAPVEALSQACQLIHDGAHAVLISGEDDIRSGYLREQRKQLMNVYAPDYPLTQAYTDLAKQFMAIHDIDVDLFKKLCHLLFENHKRSYSHALNPEFDQRMLPDDKWYAPVTELFRGVDCANPLVDFSGRVLICSEILVNELGLNRYDCIEVAGIGLSQLAGDGPEYVDQIADYNHLKLAYERCCALAGVDFNQEFHKGNALLETYTCYPVVPMAFLLVSGLVDILEKLPAFLQQHSITITGGMNLARAPWNNPALNGMITMVQRMQRTDEKIGLIHANGGLGYRQGVAILKKLNP